MNKLILMMCLLFATIGKTMGQTGEADRLLGTYMTEGNKGKVTIEKSGDVYFGKLVWSVTKGAVDKNNPVKSERTKKLVGKTILTGFKYAGKNVWEDGKIYDPENGKTYSCKITLKANGDITVRGFIGISLLGRNTTWKRVN